MKLIARLFALSLVVTGAVASTQIHNTTGVVVKSVSMGMLPAAGCDPNISGCHMSGQ